jgi:hypothetical protein
MDETFILGNVTKKVYRRIDERKPRKYATSSRIIVSIVCFLATIRIQGVYELDGQTSIESSSHQNKENSSYKHASGNQ